MHPATLEAFYGELEKIAAKVGPASSSWLNARIKSGLKSRLANPKPGKKSASDALWDLQANMSEKVRKGKDAFYATEGSQNPSHWKQHRRHERNERLNDAVDGISLNNL